MAKAKPNRTGPSYQTKNIFVLRGTDDFKQWLDGLAEANGAPLTVTTEQAYRLLAEKLGYPKPPKRVP